MPGMVMEPGERLMVEPDVSKEWPAFVLVVKGKERGWVPERYLSRRGNMATAVRRYDTTTLSPREGEILTVLEEDLESGWLWCGDEHGSVGWFPIDHIAPPSR